MNMNIELRDLPARKAACMTHNGPYFLIGAKFGEMAQWWGSKGYPPTEAVALYYDDPETTPIEKLRSRAGLFVEDDFATDDPRIEVVEVPGGKHAVGTYNGAYDGLGAAWGELCGKEIPKRGYTMRDSPSYEVYLNDCTTVPASELITELYVGVE